ncbi:hypothetical protein F5887DRAFT_1160464 [Amanita rubescens]|nr:hypothetical protein F5887DRAFT_1160464 [Amanita rubescens]
MQGTRHFLIYSTSPSRDRWSRLHKTVRTVIVIMNPWKLKEMLRAQDLQEAITALTIDELQRVLQASRSLAMNEVSHKICLISRQDRGNMYSRAVVSPITSIIKSRLASRFRKLERGEQIRLYKYFSESKVPGSRVTAGIFFEAAAHGCFQDGVTLELLPMVRLPSSRGNNKPRWHSSHISLPNATLEAARQQALRKPQSLNIPEHLPIVEYTDDGPSSIESNVLYLPELTNQVALNSFILTNDLLYIFQFSVGSVHDIKPGLIDFIRKCYGPPSMDKCRFVFIHPPNHTLICPQPRRLEMQELHPCSAALDFDRLPSLNQLVECHE